MMQRILSGHEGGATGRAGGRRVGGRKDQACIGEPVHYRRGIAHRLSAAVESRIHPADVVHQEDKDVGFLAGLLLQGGELLARFGILLRRQDDRIHVVGGLHVLQVDVLTRRSDGRHERAAVAFSPRTIIIARITVEVGPFGSVA